MAREPEVPRGRLTCTPQDYSAVRRQVAPFGEIIGFLWSKILGQVHPARRDGGTQTSALTALLEVLDSAAPELVEQGPFASSVRWTPTMMFPGDAALLSVISWNRVALLGVCNVISRQSVGVISVTITVQ